MKYILITPLGKVMQFSVRACAEMYLSALGGSLITDQLYAEAYAEVFETEIAYA
jgi:hypothetical protein